MNKIEKKACPEIHLLEAYVSNQIPSRSDRQKIAHHISHCTQCRALAAEFFQYYVILDQEKRKPVSHAVFNLIKQVEQDHVIIAGILLQPNDIKENEQSFNYQADVVLSIPKNGSMAVSDLDCIPIDDKEIFIRAIQSVATNETTLYLYANDQKLYRNVQLKIESSTDTFLSDEIGKIELGNFNIDELDEQHFIITTKSS